jgi:hypothetical protein
MGGLSDLTTYAQDTFAYTDQRTAGPKFNLPFIPTGGNFLITAESFAIERFGLEVIEVVRPTDANFSIAVDVTLFPTATVTWPNLPSGYTVINNGGLYYIEGIQSAEDWNLLKNPVITRPTEIDYFQYGVFLSWNNGTTDIFQGWIVGANIPTIIARANTALTCSGDRIRFGSKALSSRTTIETTLDLSLMNKTQGVTDFFINNTQRINKHPTLVVADPNGITFTVTVEHSTNQVSNMTSSGTGGTSIYDAASDTLTITGTQDQVNSHLSTIDFTTTATASDFEFVYSASQSPGALTAVRTQTANCRDIDRLDNIRGRAFYSGYNLTTIGTKLPLVYDINYTGSGDYTYVITVDNSIVDNMTATGGVWNSSPGTLTLTGTKTELNNWIDTVKIDVALETTDDVTLTIDLTTPETNTDQKTFDVEYRISDTDATFAINLLGFVNLVPGEAVLPTTTATISCEALKIHPGGEFDFQGAFTVDRADLQQLLPVEFFTTFDLEYLYDEDNLISGRTAPSEPRCKPSGTTVLWGAKLLAFEDTRISWTGKYFRWKLTVTSDTGYNYLEQLEDPGTFDDLYTTFDPLSSNDWELRVNASESPQSTRYYAHVSAGATETENRSVTIELWQAEDTSGTNAFKVAEGTFDIVAVSAYS